MENCAVHTTSTEIKFSQSDISSLFIHNLKQHKMLSERNAKILLQVLEPDSSDAYFHYNDFVCQTATVGCTFNI